MQLRYDGYFGFPGGLIDCDEDIVSAVNREMTEEMNLNTSIHSVSYDDHVISHWSEKKELALHFYKLKVTMAQLIEIEKQALLARDYGSEVIINIITLSYIYICIYIVLKYFLSIKNRCLVQLGSLYIHWVTITADFQHF